ncbi:DMT family transporter [Picrophilus oshimae]|uniref:EamA domain-containing membrane protein RarD n=1 Tax=Picrophilus torridus (strain ATCC 700027 / DSM 9790 / JCM 10055 / NBRC 100828 / KAW 2/3) TaxID=1122961 RepID=A0A8G2L755_PICTO|nr:DMT family transporter [Picrophilus oshimae]SMD30703.1 EamA domain-containing membrane protein RarD [Picrophilus oshimae DSM 9789]
MRSENLGISEMLASTVIWGSIPVFALWSGLPSPVFVFFRVLISFIIILFILKRESIKLIWNIKYNEIASGILLSLNWILLFYSIFLIPVSEAIVFYYTGPVIAILLAPLAGEKTTMRGYIASFASLLGVFIMAVTSIDINIAGIIIALLSGITYGLLTIFSRLSSKKGAFNLIFMQSFISIIILFPFIFLLRFKIDFNVVFIIIFSGAIQTVLALFLWYDSMKRIGIEPVSILTYLDPVFAIIFAFILLKQVPGVYTIAGAVFLIGGGVWISASRKSIKAGINING